MDEKQARRYFTGIQISVAVAFAVCVVWTVVQYDMSMFVTTFATFSGLVAIYAFGRAALALFKPVLIESVMPPWSPGAKTLAWDDLCFGVVCLMICAGLLAPTFLPTESIEFLSSIVIFGPLVIFMVWAIVRFRRGWLELKKLRQDETTHYR